MTKYHPPLPRASAEGDRLIIFLELVGVEARVRRPLPQNDGFGLKRPFLVSCFCHKESHASLCPLGSCVREAWPHFFLVFGVRIYTHCSLNQVLASLGAIVSPPH